MSKEQRVSFNMLLRIMLLLLFIPTLSFSYTIVRKDGKKFTGELVQQTPQETVIKDSEGTEMKFKADQIDWKATTQEIQKLDQPASTSSQQKEVEEQGSTRWTGEPMSFDFKDIDIRDFFRFLADTQHFNIILDPSVKGTITMKLTEVPWDQALDLVCRTYGLGYEVEGNVVDIGKLGRK